MGQIEAIFIAGNKRDAVTGVAQAGMEAGKGIVGDRYHAQADRLLKAGKAVPDNHVTFIAGEELDEFLRKHDVDFSYGDFRRNIITRGIDLNGLVDKEFKVGNSLCKGIEWCEPCTTLAGMVHSAVLPDLVHKGGLRATVLESGSVKPGDSIEAV